MPTLFKAFVMSKTIFEVPTTGEVYDLSGKVIMVHDLTQPEEVSTKVIELDKMVTELLPFIPTPIITTKQKDKTDPNEGPTVLAHYLPCNEGFLQHNPEYFLFRWKGKGKKGFKHPSHQNGIKYPNSSFFGGKHNFRDGQPDTPISGVPPERDTEWPVVGGGFNKTNLSIDPNMYVVHKDGDSFSLPNFPMLLSEYEAPGKTYNITGQKVQYNTNDESTTRKLKAMYFKVAIAINNPAYTPTNGQSPKIFGQMSDTFCIYLQNYNNEIIAWRLRLFGGYK